MFGVQIKMSDLSKYTIALIFTFCSKSENVSKSVRIFHVFIMIFSSGEGLFLVFFTEYICYQRKKSYLWTVKNSDLGSSLIKNEEIVIKICSRETIQPQNHITLSLRIYPSGMRK